MATLTDRERRGSRARCILLTNGPDEVVARRLSALTEPFAVIDPSRHHWMPRGIAEPAEAKLGDALPFLSHHNREAVCAWWLAARAHANTPNWDIASTATIDGTEGLVLVEAKAHAGEVKREGKRATHLPKDTRSKNIFPKNRSENSARNHAQITIACAEANTALNHVLPGWNLSVGTHYQLCNRFAWAWKIASLDLPVVLIYLGFLHAEEMRNGGMPFAHAADWDLVREHSRGIVPPPVWGAAAWPLAARAQQGKRI